MKTKEQIKGGIKLVMLADGRVQVYGQRRSRGLAAIGIKHSAWRLAFEVTPNMLRELNAFAQE